LWRVPETTERSQTSRRLGSLRSWRPADATLENLISLLSTKLELCARLPVCEWEAIDEGHERCASAFHEFAEAERRSCADVLDCLRAHLDAQHGTPPGKGSRMKLGFIDGATEVPPCAS
jgi:hypothetical protein